MSNELALTSMRAKMAAYRQNMPVQVGGVQFLKFAKGDWLYGRDENEVSPASRFVIAADSLGHGYKAWCDRKVTHEVRRKIFEALPAIDELPAVETDIDPDTGKPKGYQFQVGFVLAGIEGPEKGTTMQFWTESHGGIGAHTAVVEAVIERLSEEPNTPNPIVKLTVDSYSHAKYGKVKTPVFEIVGWTNEGTSYSTGAVEHEAAPKAIEKAPDPVEQEAPAVEEIDEIAALKAKLAALEADNETATHARLEASRMAASATDEPRRRRPAPKV